MASDNNAIWTNGKEEITGSWSYNWPADKFHVRLDSQPKDVEEQFRNLDFDVHDDHPEFCGWKLVRKQKPQSLIKRKKWFVPLL